MAEACRVLRTWQPRPMKAPPLTNAEKCRRYKERLKEDPMAYKNFKMMSIFSSRKYLSGLTDEQKAEKRGKDRLRQQRYRMNKKEAAQKSATATKLSCTPSSKKAGGKPSTPSVKTREQHEKETDRRERNMLSQRKRRQNMNPQKKRREREKRMAYYYKHKAIKDSPAEEKVKIKMSLSTIIKGFLKDNKMSRSKLNLFKQEFAKKLIAKQSLLQINNTKYKRPARNNFVFENFFAKHAIDYPGKRNSTGPRKILTKTLLDLFKMFKLQHPDLKCSLTTFKRRRPNNICLASSRKFNQFLCERCTNAMLCVDVINPYMKPKSENNVLGEKISNVDNLVNMTLCENASRVCWERECGLCGVTPLIDAIKLQIGNDSNTMKELKRWGKNDFGCKDLLRRQCSMADIIAQLDEDLLSLAKHLKVAEWQRGQYQSLTKDLPKGHAICTVDFAENYLCRNQNEVQSAHWSYHQVSVHPCVFFYACPHCSKSVTEYLVFLSDDLKHDSCFTKLVSDKCISHLKEKEVTSIHLFSDGCGAQYKSKTTFMDLSELQMKHNDISLTRHFFGSNHGKSLCDSCGGGGGW